MAQGYAYVLWRASGPLAEVADGVFQRWRGDASVVLDWLGQQPWCRLVLVLGVGGSGWWFRLVVGR